MRAVLDASALLAWLNDEPGADRVRLALEEGVLVSTVNWAEVLGRIAEMGGDPADVFRTVMGALGPDVLRLVPFDETSALETARLRAQTRGAQLSLGDRVCLALARSSGLPAYTSDHAWRPLAKPLGIAVVLIR